MGGKLRKPSSVKASKKSGWGDAAAAAPPPGATAAAMRTGDQGERSAVREATHVGVGGGQDDCDDGRTQEVMRASIPEHTLDPCSTHG